MSLGDPRHFIDRTSNGARFPVRNNARIAQKTAEPSTDCMRPQPSANPARQPTKLKKGGRTKSCGPLFEVLHTWTPTPHMSSLEALGPDQVRNPKMNQIRKRANAPVQASSAKARPHSSAWNRSRAGITSIARPGLSVGCPPQACRSG
jgi:hypothetical protein